MKYTVEYRATSCMGIESKDITIEASSKVEAYDRAVYEAIPSIEGEMPYSAWVASVQYKNGRSHNFNTFEGKPY